jgi:hypothetical protein
MSAQNGSDTFGTPELCTWSVGRGHCRFQTTSPAFASKLAERSGARLVGWSVNGHYLRIYQEEIEPWRARQLVTRYLTPTNEAFSAPFSPPSRPKTSGVSLEQKEVA